MTSGLKFLAMDADFYQTVHGTSDRYPKIRKGAQKPVVAATDPWSEIEYQSLYLTDEREDRIVLQEPSVKDPMVGVMVLKASRLRGESGMVYCGTLEQLKTFNAQLADFEQRGEDLDEKEFLECLVDAAIQHGLKVVYQRLSLEHGGEDYDGD